MSTGARQRGAEIRRHMERRPLEAVGEHREGHHCSSCGYVVCNCKLPPPPPVPRPAYYVILEQAFNATFTRPPGLVPPIFVPPRALGHVAPWEPCKKAWIAPLPRLSDREDTPERKEWASATIPAGALTDALNHVCRVPAAPPRDVKAE